MLGLLADVGGLIGLGAIVWSLFSGNPVLAAVLVVLVVVLVIGRRLLRPRTALGRDEQMRLAKHFRAHVASLEGAQFPAGSAVGTGKGAQQITLSDFMTDGDLFAEPIYERTGGEPANRKGLVRWVREQLSDGEAVLIVGEPGLGKTLICNLTYHGLVKAFLADPRHARIPWFVELGTLSQRRGELHGDGVHRLAELMGSGPHSVPLEPARIEALIRANRFVTVLDALDELAVHGGGEDDVIPAELAEALCHPTLLTCRAVFFDLFVATSEADRNFTRRISLRGVDFADGGHQFIRAYCRKYGLDSAQTIIDTIEASEGLTDLVTRPLLLFMATDVLAFPLPGNQMSDVAPREWQLADLYHAYVKKWLVLERRKGAVEQADEMASLCEQIAWRIYELRFDGATAFGLIDFRELKISEPELHDVIRRWRPNEPSVRTFEETRVRSFLVRAEGASHFRFAHKSFFEYFTARCVCHSLTLRRLSADQVFTLLAQPLPDEMIDFIRAMLGSRVMDATERRQAIDNLFRLLESGAADGTGDAAQVMARQQAANLLPVLLVDEPQSRARLREVYQDEAHPFIRRGIAVGFALHLRDGELIDRLIDDFDNDDSSLDYHLGYNRIYYGDQHYGASGWRDDGKPECDRLFRASIRQMGNRFYEFLWPMSVYTVRALLAEPTRRFYLLSNGSGAWWAAVREFVDAHRDDGRSSLAIECARLHQLLVEVEKEIIRK